MIPKDFVIPKTVRAQEDATETYSRFVVEPFERGYGTTIGNSLRRVLLASLDGSAVTAIRIESNQHEFSGVPGVQEDVTDIVLNFKRCHIRLNREEPIIFTFRWKGKGIVTAREIFKEQDIDVFNPDLTIMTATSESANIEMEIKVSRGRGYVTADQFELEHAPIGTVYLDASFSPVTKVNFLVEDARVGQRTDYDRLILDVWTNGSISPERAVEEAANLITEHLSIFSLGESTPKSMGIAPTPDAAELARLLDKPIDDLDLKVRAANVFKAANVRSVRDLVTMTEEDIMEFHNFGRKSLDEVKVVLHDQGLRLAMFPKVTDPQ